MSKLYEPCPVCKGAGRVALRGDKVPRECPAACQPMRAVEVGVGTRQLEAIVTDNDRMETALREILTLADLAGSQPAIRRAARKGLGE